MAHLMVRLVRKIPSFRPSHRRSRTLSQFSVSFESSKLTFDLSKLATTTNGSYNASGSFLPHYFCKSLVDIDHGSLSETAVFGSAMGQQRPVPLWHGGGVESSTPPSPENGLSKLPQFAIIHKIIAFVRTFHKPYIVLVLRLRRPVREEAENVASRRGAT